MESFRLYDGERKFMNIVWDHEPVASGRLVALCGELLGWKQSTTYTVLKKLSEKGLFKTENSMVTSLISKHEFEAMQSEQFVEETFAGSLPAFLAAFGSRKKLTDAEIDELQKVIDSMRG